MKDVRESGVVVHTLQDYVAVVRQLTRSLSGGAFWFRGQRDATWDIKPGLHRSCYAADVRGYERDIVSLFTSHAPAYLSQAPAYWIDWMVTMQHHGCPTRLLDWTESALVALYFVVCRLGRDEDASDGMIFVLDPNALAHHHGIRGLPAGAIPVSAALRAKAAEAILQEGPFAAPVPFVPAYLDGRALAQKSRLTIFPFDPCEPSWFVEPVMYRVRVAREAKAELFWQLKECGVTETSLFPDLDALARELRRHLSGGEDIP